MIEDALAWAGDVLGAPVVAHERLDGGLTSTMLALRDSSGDESVLRLMTEEPWRTHGVELTTREHVAQLALAGTDVPAPITLGLDAEGAAAGVAAHLMSRLPGAPLGTVDDAALQAMADLLATIHAVRPAAPFRTFQSWAWEAKWVVPGWTQHPDSWRRAFDLLAAPAPAYEPTFLHRDFGHRNLLWTGDTITGVVDWVETSTGPAWLDAAHAASNLAVGFGNDLAAAFVECWAVTSGTDPQAHWLVMDAVGYLPPPGKSPMFGDPAQLARLDSWLDRLVRSLS
ncbi:Phosphotransferase enzyme family protein [Nocardioides alpinus]|uniref:Aminoglycoside phosphotransferase family protein n=1 Tax=Nocardioides alpinus TaxID=748909 RepID=A0A1I0Y6C3_9ACTN|nr:aminoglycoside phosphotransferase family protein [Nocardioides alpinus]PKH39027.1 aminoglycoside phosphotransferase family protein [Nocardioides alpinus]SFB08821.1 Phosphotransferase enzyme family protein [Nocardioides alpinus]